MSSVVSARARRALLVRASSPCRRGTYDDVEVMSPGLVPRCGAASCLGASSWCHCDSHDAPCVCGVTRIGHTQVRLVLLVLFNANEVYMYLNHPSDGASWWHHSNPPCSMHCTRSSDGAMIRDESSRETRVIMMSCTGHLGVAHHDDVCAE